MEMKRSSGVLLHPTSLPGRYGIGDFGPEASRFVNFLSGSGQALWQVLPLNPTGPEGSPYQAYSAFAGNPLLISPECLVREELLPASVLLNAPEFPSGRVDFPAATRFKTELLREAYKEFKADAHYEEFCERHSDWLDNYALFMALKDSHGGADWNEWEPELAKRRSRALKKAGEELASEVGFYKFVQHLFFREHGDLKREANAKGIQLIGDIPIFVAHNSADVWSNPELFHLDKDGRATVVAGVPPDYFSATGQRWGNPLYRWDRMEQHDYSWWIDRLRMALTLYDMVRIDHFRGFEAYWAIPAEEETAVHGQWVPGPGAKFFEAVNKELGDLPIIAEDLGVITPEVEKLRDDFRLPGMKVIQFAFSDPDNVYLPHNYANFNCVVYTGTHDNNTTEGWWETAGRKERHFARSYVGHRGGDIAWDLIRLAMASVAKLAIVPLQDVLSLGAEARMNTPGTSAGNWAWRCGEADLTADIQDRLKEMTEVYGRASEVHTPVTPPLTVVRGKS
jgi:4-alpha-glucanotransferase